MAAVGLGADLRRTFHGDGGLDAARRHAERDSEVEILRPVEVDERSVTYSTSRSPYWSKRTT
ncbi:hypothetical protein [Streptomyces sp. 4N124]|uniref:hypothetical protein n=1 Tax=Streptomyces sp. 4N124 TaxID=3457420 RepID=UPI003FCFFD9D